MNRTSPLLLALGAIWIVAAVAAVLVAVFGGWSVAAHGYFAGWLIAVSIPLGALPILLVATMTGQPETPTLAALRLLLAALPVVAILVIPVLFDLSGVFPWAAGSHLAPASAEPLKGFAKSWYRSEFFVVRTIVYLALWIVLSLFFVRPAAPSSRHRRIAGAGLALHLVIGTLAAYDWWMSLDMAFLSSVYGLIVIGAQAVFALAVASLIALPAPGRSPDRPMLLLLLTVLFAAAFVQFSQFLVIWSANLPGEIVWYQSRWVGLLGPVCAIGLPVLLLVIAALIAPESLSALRTPVLAALAVTVLIALLDLVCLASPRSTFTFPGLGIVLAFLVVVVGLGAGCALALGGRAGARRAIGEPRHG